MKKILVLIITLLVTFSLAGCGAEASPMDYEGNDYTDNNTNPIQPEPDYAVPELNGGVVINEATIPELLDRKIIYSAELDMETPAPKDLYNTISALINDYTAYVEASNITSQVIVVRIRVLSTEFADFIDAVKQTGDIVSFESSSQDVTNDYNSLEARQTALLTHQTRLLELIAEASFNEMVQLMDELEDVEAELIDIATQLSTYNSLIDYSTLEVTIIQTQEVELIAPKTSLPSVRVDETTKDTIIIDVYNYHDDTVTINLDLYQNGEFVREYTETSLPDSETSFVIDELDSNKEYKVKVTVVAAEHRVSNEVSLTTKTDPTYLNNVGNVFNDSISLLIGIVKGIGYVIVALSPFALIGVLSYVGYRLLIKKYPHLKIKKRQRVHRPPMRPQRNVKKEVSE